MEVNYYIYAEMLYYIIRGESQKQLNENDQKFLFHSSIALRGGETDKTIDYEYGVAEFYMNRDLFKEAKHHFMNVLKYKNRNCDHNSKSSYHGAAYAKLIQISLIRKKFGETTDLCDEVINFKEKSKEAVRPKAAAELKRCLKEYGNGLISRDVVRRDE